MSLEDFAARMKRAQQPSAPAPAVDPAESFRIRARMVGVLLRDARIAAGRTEADCAQVLHVPLTQFEAWELGNETPSLPQLELLANYLNVPVSHFWGTTTREQAARDFTRVQQEYMALRDRMIGVLLRQAREDSGADIASLSEETTIPADLITQYELGELAVPLHELSVLANALRKNMSWFLESSSQLGELLALRELALDFARLPPHLRQFAANPINIGFLEIAQMLSQMPADRLRLVGESILNITM